MPIIVAVGLLAILTLFKYEQIIRDNVDSRYLLMTGETKDRLEQWLKSGFPITNLPGVEAMLQQFSSLYKEDFLVDIIDRRGNVLHSTDPSRVNDAVSENWQIKLRTIRDNNTEHADHINQNQIVQFNEDSRRIIGRLLYDNLNQWSGSIIISFPESIYRDLVKDVQEKLIYYFVLLTIFLILVAFLITWFILRLMVRDINELTHIFNKVLNYGTSGTKNDHEDKENNTLKNSNLIENKFIEAIAEVDKFAEQVQVIDQYSEKDKLEVK